MVILIKIAIFFTLVAFLVWFVRKVVLGKTKR